MLSIVLPREGLHLVIMMLKGPCFRKPRTWRVFIYYDLPEINAS